MERRWRVGTIALVAVVAAVAVTTGSAGATAKPTPSKVTIGIRVDIDKFDPYASIGDLGAAQAFKLLYDTLVRRTPAGRLVPGIASSWSVTPTVGVFHIRPNIYCADGSKLTPGGVANSLRYLGDPQHGSQFSSRMFGPGGFASITANNKKSTVTVRLNAPNSDMLLGATNVGTIICPKGLQDPTQLATTPDGTGPYALTSEQRGQSYTLTRRSNFTALNAPTKLTDLPKQIVLQVVPDDTTQANLLLSGQLNIANVQGLGVKRLQGQQGVHEVKGYSFGVFGLLLNHAVAPGNDVQFRRAIAMATSPNQYDLAAYGGLAMPRNTAYTPNLDCFNKHDAAGLVRGNKAKAAAALTAAGYTLKNGVRTNPDGSPLTVRIVAVAGNETEAEFNQNVLESIGLHTQLLDLSYNQAVATIAGTKWDMVGFPFTSGLPSPSLYISQISGDFPKTLNFGRINNTTFNTLAAQALATTGPKRCQLWDEAEQAILKDGDVIPFVQIVTHWFAKGVSFDAGAAFVDPYSIRAG